MAILNLSLDAFNMDPEAVSEGMKKISDLIQEIEQNTDFMTKKIEAVHDLFASRNYDKITEALAECKTKLAKTQEELSELITSCNKLATKIQEIEE